MTALRGWVECAPNFSEGRDAHVLAALRRAIESAGVKLLDRTADPDHHRSVFTFAGSLPAVENAVLRAAETAVEKIDLASHRGVHPRIGALDVVPLIPLGDTPFDACVDGARRIARRLWSQLEIPVYLYGRAARSPERRRLSSSASSASRSCACRPTPRGAAPMSGDPFRTRPRERPASARADSWLLSTSSCAPRTSRRRNESPAKSANRRAVCPRSRRSACAWPRGERFKSP